MVALTILMATGPVVKNETQKYILNEIEYFLPCKRKEPQNSNIDCMLLEIYLLINVIMHRIFT